MLLVSNKSSSKGLRSASTITPWLIWVLAAAFYAYEFSERINISVFLPFIIHDLKISATEVGVMSAFYYYAYALMQLPAGILIDYLGAKKLTAVGIILVSVGAILMSSMDSVLTGSLARFVLGVGSAFAFICTMKFIVVWFPKKNFAFMAGLTNLFGYVGATLGEVPTTNLVYSIGWRHTLLLSAGIGLVLFFLVLLFVQDGPQKHHQHKSKPTSAHGTQIFKGLKHIMSKGKCWSNGIYTTLMVGPTSAFAGLWGVGFLHTAHHLTNKMAAGALSAIFIGVALGSPIFGWWSQKINRRQPFLIVAALGAFLVTIPVFFFSDVSVIFIYVLCFLFGFFQSAHVLNFAIAKDLVKKKHAGTATGFTNMMLILGGVILQPLIGFMLDAKSKMVQGHVLSAYTVSSYHFALSTIPVFFVLAFVVAIFFLKDGERV